MTRRRWIAERWDEATACIAGAQAEHLSRVLRAEPGMEADVVAGGRVFHAQVAAVAPHEVRFNLIAEVEADRKGHGAGSSRNSAGDCATHRQTPGAGGIKTSRALAAHRA